MTKDPREAHDVTPDELVSDVTDSDANGNTPEGLAGDMGVSSERVGPLRGAPRDATHGAGPQHPEAPYDAEQLARQGDTAPDLESAPPEQNADPTRGPEIQPDLPPRTNPTESAPNPLGPGPDHESASDWRTVKPGQEGKHTGGPEGESEFDAIGRAEHTDG